MAVSDMNHIILIIKKKKKTDYKSFKFKAKKNANTPADVILTILKQLSN